ncbi:hypothetical protein AK812_SmicGene3365 [Symbiodinium microadriaticum]|uniref:Uncharacterized protein n=1 Tax=Symbiodinium microadriaticum TaxID=2951 RepID=A0A1Q9EZ95_SYMMI|nr:hypothetical protein AK812_SmicGene3365 [Symbiodinium microadriaticum]
MGYRRHGRDEGMCCVGNGQSFHYRIEIRSMRCEFGALWPQPQSLYLVFRPLSHCPGNTYQFRAAHPEFASTPRSIAYAVNDQGDSDWSDWSEAMDRIFFDTAHCFTPPIIAHSPLTITVLIKPISVMVLVASSNSTTTIITTTTTTTTNLAAMIIGDVFRQ